LPVLRTVGVTDHPIADVGDMAMSDEQQASEDHYREIAEKVRQLARQTYIPEAREELFDLADWLDREAELAKKD
jgi:hypothetical protein